MIYCASCGSREIHVEEWREANTGFFVCIASDAFYCASCEGECDVVTSRHEAAEARLAERKRKACGCTCLADLARSTFDEAKAGRVRYWLGKHAKHCPAWGGRVVP